MYESMNGRMTRVAMMVACMLLCVGRATPALAQHESPATHPDAISPEAPHPDDVAHPGEAGEGEHPGDAAHGEHPVPSLVAALPFVVILLCIAILPLIHRTEHWWHHNKNKLTVSVVLAAVVLVYYFTRDYGFHGPPGLPTIKTVLNHAVLQDYIPFIVLLFSLYTISGGIQLTGDLKATPRTNTMFIGAGTIMASFIGTTGAAMLLIRPVLQTNAERKYKKHTVIFFIFLVANIGGSLLPIGDPPLFLGYLRGVPFTWTLHLWEEWLLCGLIVLIVYYIWDTLAYRREPPLEHLMDETHLEPLRLKGKLNFLWLLGVVLSVALLVPGRPFLGTGWVVPDYTPGLRELAQLIFAGIAWKTTAPRIREENRFDFFAILEVAALFIGIFITMQVPIEILNLQGARLGLTSPAHFFWATGALSSFLDNAPTYVVFFETANALTHSAGPGIQQLVSGHFIRQDLLVGISLGAVFMGANTYIGNGPNFMVKSIAEQSGVKMPSFFGYMLYSGLILMPIFALVTLVFLI
jgi:Na+/H+ antiporter NhaD/arsenite permease-like protein